MAEHLRGWIDYSGSDSKLHLWRTREGNEVDFVVYGRDVFWALEVKLSTDVRPQGLRGLRAFREDYRAARTVLLFMGTEPVATGDIRCILCESFLRSLVPGKIAEVFK